MDPADAIVGSNPPNLPAEAANHQISQPPSQQLPIRACEACKRKKTKCDMRRPVCSLCVRVGGECKYPTRRKRPEPRVRRDSMAQLTEYVRKNTAHIDQFMKMMDSRRLSQDRSNTTRKLSPSVFVTGSVRDSRDDPDEISPDSFSSGINTLNDRMEMDNDHSRSTKSSANPDAAARSLGFDTNMTSESSLNPLETSPTFWDSVGGISPYADLYFPLNDDFRLPQFDMNQTLDQLQEPPRSNVEVAITHSIHVPSETVDDLIDTFFQKIHGFIPIFHRPRFYSKHVNIDADGLDKYTSLSQNTAFIINGMCALSARFSVAPIFDGIPVKDRGTPFAQRAMFIYQEAPKDEEFNSAELSHLQGCILLAFYYQTASANSKSWLLTGACCRIAYDLGLNSVDEDIINAAESRETLQISAEDWVHREELRRAWWSIWELDAFASTVSCKPYSINQTLMHVLLPVSDANWFSEKPVESTRLGEVPLTTWNSLQSSQNQDERAWFLVCNCLLKQASELGQRHNIPTQARKDLETALTCFSLTLPPQFHLNSPSLVFNDANYSRNNWIIATNLLLQGARIYCFRMKGNESSSLSHAEDTAAPSGDAPLNRDKSTQEYRQYVQEMLRAVKVWAPEYIALCSPFIVCSLLGPASLVIKDSHEMSAEGQMVELAIARFASYWNLGSIMLKAARGVPLVNTSSDETYAPPKEEISKRFAALLPPSSEKPNAQHLSTL